MMQKQRFAEGFLNVPSLHFEDNDLTIDADTDTTLRELAKANGVQVFDRCGGNGVCCSCVVTIVSGAEHVTPKSDLEEAVTYMEANDRLSCQCKLTGTGPVHLRANPG